MGCSMKYHSKVWHKIWVFIDIFSVIGPQCQQRSIGTVATPGHTIPHPGSHLEHIMQNRKLDNSLFVKRICTSDFSTDIHQEQSQHFKTWIWKRSTSIFWFDWLRTFRFRWRYSHHLISIAAYSLLVLQWNIQCFPMPQMSPIILSICIPWERPAIFHTQKKWLTFRHLSLINKKRLIKK